jgi:hypothetical protein
MKIELPIIGLNGEINLIDCTDIVAEVDNKPFLLFNLPKLRGDLMHQIPYSTIQLQIVNEFLINPFMPTIGQFVQWCHVYKLNPKDYFNDGQT